MTALSSDPVCIRAQLLATRLVLQETLDRLPADRLAELQSALDTLVAGLRDDHGDDVPLEQAHIIDELEAITLRLRYLDQPVEQPDADARAGDRTHTAVCMRCEHFPIHIGASCPQCQTDRWVNVVRS